MNVREYLQGKKSMTCSQWVETIKKRWFREIRASNYSMC